jgi:hypothetical protein
MAREVLVGGLLIRLLALAKELVHRLGVLVVLLELFNPDSGGVHTRHVLV